MRELVTRFIAEAQKHTGKQYVPGATGLAGRLIDCIHVPVRAMVDIGYLPADYKVPPYPPSGNPALWAPEMSKWLDEVEKPSSDACEDGDIAILYDHLQKDAAKHTVQYPRHCGILFKREGEWRWFGINFAVQQGMVEDVPFHNRLWRRVYKVYRLRDGH